MKFRTLVNVITAILLVLAIYLGRHQVYQAWALVGRVDLRIFALMVPIQLFSYYAVGEVMFSYLRAKGQLENMSKWRMARIALELNFVNHIIPVPSIAGFSYLGWVLHPAGVGAGRATMAQIIRYVMMFGSFVALIFISVVFLAFDQGVSRTTILISVAFIVATILATSLLIYLIGNRDRLVRISKRFTKIVNTFMTKVTFGRRKNVLKEKLVVDFFCDLHQDYLEINNDKKILVKPLLWALLANVLDVALILVAFFALGTWVNPATLFVAYGIASFVAIFAATPGGSGFYEAVMIAFLASAGVPAGTAIAGTLLARATLFLGTVTFGYLFYQLTINKYGKIKKPIDIQRK